MNFLACARLHYSRREAAHLTVGEICAQYDAYCDFNGLPRAGSAESGVDEDAD